MNHRLAPESNWRTTFGMNYILLAFLLETTHVNLAENSGGSCICAPVLALGMRAAYHLLANCDRCCFASIRAALMHSSEWTRMPLSLHRIYQLLAAGIYSRECPKHLIQRLCAVLQLRRRGHWLSWRLLWPLPISSCLVPGWLRGLLCPLLLLL